MTRRLRSFCTMNLTRRKIQDAGYELGHRGRIPASYDVLLDGKVIGEYEGGSLILNKDLRMPVMGNWNVPTRRAHSFKNWAQCKTWINECVQMNAIEGLDVYTRV